MIFKSTLTFLLLQCFFVSLSAQETQIDSLKTLLKTHREDTVKVDILNDMAGIQLRAKPAEAVDFATEAKYIAENLQYEMGLGTALYNLGIGYFLQGKYIDCVENLSRALQIFESKGSTSNEISALSHMGSLYYTLGDNSKTILYYRRALSVAEEMGDISHIGAIMLNIGEVYSDQEEYMDSAFFYYRRTLHLGESAGDMDLIGFSIIDLGEFYFQRQEYDSALYFFEKSRSVISDHVDYSVSLNYMGRIYADMNEFDKAIEYHRKALDMAKAEYSALQLSQIYLGLASTYHKKGDDRSAIKYYNQAKSLAEELGSSPELSDAYEGLASSYAELSDFKNAYNYSLLQNQILLSSKETDNDRTKHLLLLYSSDEQNREAEIETLEQQSIIEQLRNKRQRILNITSGSIGFLLLLLVAGLFHRFLYIRKTRDMINRQKNEIEAQRDEIEAQRNQLFRQQKNITDSLRYAENIQNSLLPSKAYIDRCLSEYFIIFQPRDIVSGDFYWIKEFKHHLIIIVADCTGHGVPGGFMSMLGVTLLNDLIDEKKLDRPGEILEDLRLKIKQMLTQNGKPEEQKDGMDMALMVLNTETRKLLFAGANNPIYLIRNNRNLENGELKHYLSIQNNNYSLFEIKGDKQPIGVYWEEGAFTQKQIQLQEKDALYIFSDGIIDQFGGDQRKKFKAANFKKLLLSVQSETFEFQKQRIESAFSAWKGDYEQIDDVCVFGLKI
ncbi:MAG: tetratricopeptide repeat protein [Bacteroidales bacterium]